MELHYLVEQQEDGEYKISNFLGFTGVISFLVNRYTTKEATIKVATLNRTGRVKVRRRKTDDTETAVIFKSPDKANPASFDTFCKANGITVSKDRFKVFVDDFYEEMLSEYDWDVLYELFRQVERGERTTVLEDQNES